MWNKIDGCLYIICDGKENDCRLIQKQCQLKETYVDQVMMIVDSDSTLREQFHVEKPVSAIVFDELGWVQKSGHLLPKQTLQTPSDATVPLKGVPR